MNTENKALIFSFVIWLVPPLLFGTILASLAAGYLFVSAIFYWLSWVAIRSLNGKRPDVSKLWHFAGVSSTAMLAATIKFALVHMFGAARVLGTTQEVNISMMFVLPFVAATIAAAFVIFVVASRPPKGPN